MNSNLSSSDLESSGPNVPFNPQTFSAPSVVTPAWADVDLFGFDSGVECLKGCCALSPTGTVDISAWFFSGPEVPVQQAAPVLPCAVLPSTGTGRGGYN